MTESTRPDMTLEQIIDREQAARDAAATYADLLPLMVAEFGRRSIGSRGWRNALWWLNRCEKRRLSESYAAHNWRDQRQRSFRYYIGHYPRSTR